MSGDPGIRRLLPQNGQMQNFAFATTNFGPRENQKSAHRLQSERLQWLLTTGSIDYVFVDEHNRHKRLKGMLNCRAATFPFC